MEDERILKTTVSGAPVDANTWQHSVAATPTGFAIAGTRAPLETGGFQVFVQRIDDQGNPVGETIDGHPEADVAHQNAAIASHEDGTLFVGWGREHDIDDLEPYHAKIAPDGTTMLPDPPIAAVSGRTGAYPTMAAPASGPAYLAFQSEQQGITNIIVKDATAFNGESLVLEFSVNRANSFAPRVAAADDGGAVAWFVQPSGNRSLAVRRFGYDGSTWSRGPQLSISAGSGQVAPSVPGLVHLAGSHYFVSWAEGVSPGYVLQGRFITLEAQ
jgi:hypothetical protein